MSNPYTNISIDVYCDPTTNERRGILYSADRIDKNATEIVIPEARFDGTPVRELGAQAFWYHRQLRSVTLPDSIDNIRDAFLGVETLERINIPASLKCIRAGAFSCCKALREVRMPENASLERIQWKAFLNCEALMELRIPATVTHIEDRPGLLPFAGCGGAKPTGQYHYEMVEMPPYAVPSYGSDSETRYVHGDNVEIYNGYAVKPGYMEKIKVAEYENSPYGDLTLIVDKGSYAEDYARRMGIRFRYAE